MNEGKNILKIGTLFSGIGAFEEALRQLKLQYSIEFACDNGEIELTPLPFTQRCRYNKLEKNKESLSEEEKIELQKLKDTISSTYETIRSECDSKHTEGEKIEYIESLYKKYSPQKTNWVKKTYLQNFKVENGNFYPDVRFLDGSKYENCIDIIVGGSPCQSFSNYGKKLGLEDTRGTLFYDYARIIKDAKPKVFIYENVESILTNDHHKTWETIQEVLRSLDYEIFSDVIDASEHNFPQKRRRLFLVGFRKDLSVTDYKFPETVELSHKSEEYLEKGVVPEKYYLGKKGFEWITTLEKHQHRARVNQDVIGTQTANQQQNWTGDLRIERPRPEHYANDKIYVGKFDFGQGPEDAVARKLTPRECLNLMGFSPSFNIDGLSDNVVYRQAGNSIVVPVLKDIVETLLPYLEN